MAALSNTIQILILSLTVSTSPGLTTAGPDSSSEEHDGNGEHDSSDDITVKLYQYEKPVRRRKKGKILLACFLNTCKILVNCLTI